jgi:hypothetical protein
MPDSFPLVTVIATCFNHECFNYERYVVESRRASARNVGRALVYGEVCRAGPAPLQSGAGPVFRLR